MSDGYGYGGKLGEIRKAYGNLPKAYLDNAAAPLFPHTIPRLAADALCSVPLANPHSQISHAFDTARMVSDVRIKVLEQLNCDPAEFDLVFCANATAAAKIVGEALHAYEYAYLKDSHTSLVGLRELAQSYRMCATLDSVAEQATERTVVSWPLQSNFDGRRYTDSQQIIDLVHEKNGLVLLDIASYAATSMPDLSSLKPDMAVLSFYKIYGLPDLGALIVRKHERTYNLFSHKRYFGGGTVTALASGEHYVDRKTAFTDFLEDGTAPFHSILFLRVAMEEFHRLYVSHTCITKHTTLVARYCKSKLREVPHCTIYAPSDSPIISFRLDDIGHNEFATAAALQDVHVRAGTLCNIGAFTEKLGVSDTTIIEDHRRLGKACNDDISFIGDRPTGVIRVSFGPYSSYEDVDQLLDIIKKVTLAGAALLPERELSRFPGEPAARIVALYTYPIKSCGPASLQKSLVGAHGLQYDRQFCLVDLSDTKVLSLKKYRTMAFLKPTVALPNLTVQCERFEEPKSISIPYHPEDWTSRESKNAFVLNTSEEVISFFSRAVGIPCTIAKNSTSVTRSTDSSTLATRMESSLANSSPLLVVSLRSAAALDLSDVNVFRPNIVLETKDAWVEDTWETLAFPGADISMLGKCRRCSMVTVKENGLSDSRPYIQLCKFRKQDGKIYFGQHAKIEPRPGIDSVVSVGDEGLEL